MMVSTSATVDWGDGTTETISPNASYQTIGSVHTYANGDFVLHITGYDDCQLIYIGSRYGGSHAHWSQFDALRQLESDTVIMQGNGNAGYSPIPPSRNLRHINLTKCTSMSNVCIGAQYCVHTMLAPKVETLSNPWTASEAGFEELSFPSLTSITGQAFNGMTRLESLSFGNGVSSFPDNCVRNLPHLKYMRLPDSMTSLGSNFLYVSGKFMDSLKVPEGISDFSVECFRNCGLRRLELPSTVTSMGSSPWSFYGIISLEEFIIHAVTPPTLAGTNNLNALSPWCRIYVPHGSGETYKTATNWSVQASKIYELDTNGNIPS